MLTEKDASKGSDGSSRGTTGMICSDLAEAFENSGVESGASKIRMDFKVSIDEHADAYSVVVVHGEVDLHTAPKVQYAIKRGSEGVEVVVVDMSSITFMDSTALSTLMRAKETLEEKGTYLRLTAPSEAVGRIFVVTGFGDYFDIYPSREAAVPN
jgi:anti-sigma B factor antagonist